MYAKISKAAKTYRHSAAEHAVDTDDGHTLILKLMTRLLARIAMAKHCIDQKEVASKGEHLGQAIDILNVLRVSLDNRHNPQLAENLDALYDYAARRVLHANMHDDTDALTEVDGLLREVKEAWSAVAPEAPAA
ncbi:MAG: flagellar export chaperone FliS [Pseudomonadota bacterium]